MFVILLSLLWVLPAGSHPHVFVYSAVDVVFDDAGLVGFLVKWRFDEMFSSTIIMDFDKNSNNKLEASEIKAIEKGAFSNLKEFDYFSHVNINEKPFKVRFVTDFSADIVNGKLGYRFFIPCHVTAIATEKTITLSIYDQTFYSSVFWVKNPVTCVNAEPYTVNHLIEKDRDNAYYFGQMYPEQIILRFKQKNE